eukprot:TRINITY_DN5287_c0_g1_i1.p1 TRINITY_DN5287_c0_g1~~TRINITY_DN5287_c0_g1_i1.p1  ORF type:complete len:790 (+),score=202.87 TRINITY_DN5287_c0_g1_i1:44-2371(+)
MRVPLPCAAAALLSLLLCTPVASGSVVQRREELSVRHSVGGSLRASQRHAEDRGVLRAGDAGDAGAAAEVAKGSREPVKTWEALVVWVSGVAMFLAGFALWCCVLPGAVCSAHADFENQQIQGRSFGQYLTYHFNYWMSSEGVGANVKLLGVGYLTLACVGALTYWLVRGASPFQGLWMVFVWSSAGSVAPDASVPTRIVGMCTTLGGLLLLALLLTTITEYFQSRVEAMKEGRDPVVEGDHVVIVGYNASTRSLLEEFALVSEESPLTVALLTAEPKVEVEKKLEQQNMDLKQVKLVVRTGHPSSWQDLLHVAADSARSIVIPEDASLTREESDASTFGTLLTLKGRGWPLHGHISAQCCLSRNDALMQTLYKEKAYVVNGERIGRLMVQGARDQGLCQVFGQIIGFDGDEFYAGAASELGVVGTTFRELPFWFPETIPIGFITEKGEYLINPDKSYEVQPMDRVILLAEDGESFGPIEEEPFLDYSAWAAERKEATFEEEDANDYEQAKSLLCNFNDRGVACSVLFALDEMMAPGSEVDIYTGLSEQECEEILANAQRRQGSELKNVKTKIFSAKRTGMAAMHELERLPLSSYDYCFVLADAEIDGPQRADQRTVAMIAQMRTLLASSKPTSPRSLSATNFDPVVEVCSSQAASQLALCGVNNSVNTGVMLSKALAMVGMSVVAHGVLVDLLSADGNNFDIMKLPDYLASGEEMPESLSFAEATAIVTRAAQQVLVGWSQGRGSELEWIINPKDKLESRPWTIEDRLVVIKDV